MLSRLFVALALTCLPSCYHRVAGGYGFGLGERSRHNANLELSTGIGALMEGDNPIDGAELNLATLAEPSSLELGLGASILLSPFDARQAKAGFFARPFVRPAQLAWRQTGADFGGCYGAELGVLVKGTKVKEARHFFTVTIGAEAFTSYRDAKTSPAALLRVGYGYWTMDPKL